MKILIVEDNTEFAYIIQNILESEGYETRLAQDVYDGYLTYLFFRPDLVITDLQMPGENGLELIRHIRMHNPDIKTIYMSGDLRRFWSLLEDEKKQYKVKLLEKPFTYGELQRVIAEFQRVQ